MEWRSTKDARFWEHVPCGNSVALRNGLPVSHRCSEQWDNEAYKTMGFSYVDGDCVYCGATVHPDNREQHSNWHDTFIHRSEVKDGFAVSAVKWCDAGGHAFKAGEPGSQSLDVTQRDDAGKEERVTMDMCSKHAFPTGNTDPTMRAVERAYQDEIPGV